MNVPPDTKHKDRPDECRRPVAPLAQHGPGAQSRSVRHRRHVFSWTEMRPCLDALSLFIVYVLIVQRWRLVVYPWNHLLLSTTNRLLPK